MGLIILKNFEEETKYCFFSDMWNVYQFCTHVDLICVPNLQIEDQLVLTWKRWGGAGVGVYRAAGQELCFPALAAAIPPPLPVFLLGCTVQCLRRRIDRVLLAGGGREAESRPGSYEPLLVDMTGVVQ